MTRARANKITAAAWSQLAYVLDNKSWSRYASNYLAENVEEEKNHRGSGRFGGWALTVNESARLFAVRQLAEYLTTKKRPDLKSYLHCRRSIYTASSLVLNYRKEIRAAFKAAKVDLAEVCALDYAELVKTE